MLAAVVGGAVIATMGFVAWTVVDERSYFEAEQARDRRQDEALEQVLRSQEAQEMDQARTLEAAIDEVTVLLGEQFALHDHNSATVHNDLLAQIAALLGRPVPAQPSAPAGPASAPAPGARAPSPAPRSAPTPPARPSTPPAPEPAPAPTTPDQRRCAVDPNHPRC